MVVRFVKSVWIVHVPCTACGSGDECVTDCESRGGRSTWEK